MPARTVQGIAIHSLIGLDSGQSSEVRPALQQMSRGRVLGRALPSAVPLP